MRTGLFLLVLVFSVAAPAQLPVPSAGLSLVNRLFDSPPNPARSLKCKAQTHKGALDFAFRFNAYYLLSCNLAQLEPGSRLSVYVRVKPESGDAVVLGRIYRVPPIAPEVAARLPKSALKKWALK